MGPGPAHGTSCCVAPAAVVCSFACSRGGLPKHPARRGATHLAHPAAPALQALQQALAEILEAATAQPQEGTQRAGEEQRGGDSRPTQACLAAPELLLARQAHWAATAAAAARHPALHLLVRRTLHAWFAASGNSAAWRLLLHYVHAARSAHAPLLRQGHLPADLRLLYPPGLRGVAALLHTQRPSDAGLTQAVAQLHSYVDGSAAAAAAAAEGAAAAAASPWEQAAATAERQQQAWQLLLDAPAWLLFCLLQLPLQQLLALAVQQAQQPRQPGSPAMPPSPAAGDHPLPEQIQGEALPLSSRDAASPAAAQYAALVLWAGEPGCQQVLREALQLQLGDVDLAALRPWLQMLRRWQPLLQAAADADAALLCP